jgi:hypothetical protein
MTAHPNSRKRLIVAVVVAAVVVLLGVGVYRVLVAGTDAGAAVDVAAQFDSGAVPYPAGLPDEQAFELAAENERLRLLVNKATAHFQLVDKVTGKRWRSYPDPALWAQETVPTTWKNQLSSPITIEYVNVNNYKSATTASGLLDNQGYLENFRLTDNGFAVTFVFAKAKFKIPVEVALHADYVETSIQDDGIVEGDLSLLNAKIYPLFGAQPSNGQEGYLFLPDGAGALIRFNEERVLKQLTYNEGVYGQDLSFFNENKGRQRIAMPVYGLKGEEQGFVAIIAEGEAYANVFAAPAGSVGLSNWITTEWQYRKRFFQSVSRNTGEGFFTYSRDKFVADKRATRYYPLLDDANDYVGMAGVYRNYLMEEKGVKPVVRHKPDIPLVLDIVGGDIEQGLLFNEYLKGTTTKEAEQIVQRVYDLGIRNINVHYSGWQQDGYSSHGGYFPVDGRIGGNSGMKQFIDFAHRLDIPVYLTANYAINTNGKDGFWWRRDGLRNLAGTVLEWQQNEQQEPAKYVSPRFYEKVIRKDLEAYRNLNADGIYFEGGVGQQVSTDFNTRYAASRSEVVETQRRILQQARQTLGASRVQNANFYALDQIDYVYRLTADYSYDVFVSEAIPFAQIVLHGLIPYSLEWSNLRDEPEPEFLRSIEYGANPAYVLAGDRADDMRRAYSVWYYSLNYQDWLEQIGEEYRRANEALKDVQDRFITAHRTLAPGVKETVYGDDYRIIVNYNDTPYRQGDLVVAARDFAVVNKGGDRS